MANINNIKTGNVNIPGALHSTANDGGGQVGNVVAYTGDIYDTTAGKNQATLNAEFAEGIANAGGGGAGTITGATVGGSPVTESSGILQFDAYPTVPIEHVKMEGEQNDLTITNKRVVIPQPPVKGIKTNSGSDLTPVNGIVTLPAIPADQSSRIKNIEDTLQQIANAEPIVIPASAVELPTSANSTITYDPDDTYVMNISDTQIATVHYPYEHSTDSYLAFKAIDRDLYYVYQLTNAANNTYTFVEQHTYDELSHNEAKAVFEAGKYAVKQVIDVRHTGNPLPEGYFKHGIPSAFVTPDGYPLRYNQIKENNVWYILLKCDENNKIFKYSASNNKWSLVNGGCYVKNDATTGENYEKYDAYFDRQPASNVSFDDSITQLGTQEYPITDVQLAIQKLATKVYGYNGTIILNLLYASGNPVPLHTTFNLEVTFQGEAVDFSDQLTSDNTEYTTVIDGTRVFCTNSSGQCRINVPIGAVYSISFKDIANYETPNNISGVVDIPQLILNNTYTPVSEVETVLLLVVLHNAAGTSNPSNKHVYIDYYSGNQVNIEKAYDITVDENGVPSTIKKKNNSSYETVSNIEIPHGIVYSVYGQDWDDSETPEYSKSSLQKFTAQNVNRAVRVIYTNVLSGLYLMIKNTEIPAGCDNYKIYFEDGISDRFKIIRKVGGVDVTYWVFKNTSNNGIYIYEDGETESDAIEWISSSNINDKFIGIGVRSATLNATSNSGRSVSQTCAFFIVPDLNVSTEMKPRETANIGAANSIIDGLLNEEPWLDVAEYGSPATLFAHNFTNTIASTTYNGFWLAYRQFENLLLNYNSLSLVFTVFGKTMYPIKTGKWGSSTVAQPAGGAYTYWNNGSATQAYTWPNIKVLPGFPY